MLNIILSAVTSFVIVYISIPSIIKVARLKHLFDFPEERKAHTTEQPTLGGLAIFAGVIFSFTFWTASMYFPIRQYLIAAIIILFFIGMKDDIIIISPLKKLVGQILAAFIVVFFAGVRLTSFHGLFNMYVLPEWASIVVSIFTILVIINSINFIDGVDGLAAGIGIIACMVFGVLLYYYGEYVLSLLAFSLLAGLLAFMFYNYSPAKIFMGDTGSLIVGFVLSVLSIRFIEIHKTGIAPIISANSSPVLAIAVLIVPLTDMVRVFCLRIYNGKSPLAPDRNHIHHLLLGLGWSHRRVSIVLYATSFCFIAFTFILRDMDSMKLLGLLTFFGLLLNALPFIVRSVKPAAPFVAELKPGEQTQI
jgi:UDP-N-acetylmuramyl pentapeptide phosphotransferase/UDP-N-acetylglucosamine-1-phosphate transferase